MASRTFCDTQRACPSLLWSTTGRPRMTGSLSISSYITRGLVPRFAWIRNWAYSTRPLLCGPLGMIPSPTLNEVRDVMIDRRVCLDIVGNVFHGLCGPLQPVRRERSGTCMTQAQQPHRVRSEHPPWESASEPHTLGRGRGNLWDGMLCRRTVM